MEKVPGVVAHTQCHPVPWAPPPLTIVRNQGIHFMAHLCIRPNLATAEGGFGQAWFIRHRAARAAKNIVERQVGHG